jgi:hypothetical protein
MTAQRIFRGHGKVFRNQQFIARVQYELRTTPNRAPSGSPVISDAQLTMKPVDAFDPHFGDCLTLHMNDGNKQHFYIETTGSPCLPTGGPH